MLHWVHYKFKSPPFSPLGLLALSGFLNTSSNTAGVSLPGAACQVLFGASCAPARKLHEYLSILN